MKKILTLLTLLVPSIFLTAAKEPKEVLVKREERKLITNKKAAEKGAPSRRIHMVSHTTSLAVSMILNLLDAYCFAEDSKIPEGLFGNKILNVMIFSFLFSVVGFYFYLHMESFLAKKTHSAMGKFFSGLVSFLLSGCVLGILVFFYDWKGLGVGGIRKGLYHIYVAGLMLSLFSFFSWWIYTGINWSVERARKEAAGKMALHKKIKMVSHTTSITLPVILFLILFYFVLSNDAKGFFGNKHVNRFIYSILSSVVGFYFYLYIESFLAKKLPFAMGKFFSGLISFLLSGCVGALFFSIYIGNLPQSLEDIGVFFLIGLISSLNSSLFSWWIYTGINRFASSWGSLFSLSRDPSSFQQRKIRLLLKELSL